MGDEAACGDVMEPTSISVKWLSFTNRNFDEAQTSEHVLGQMSYLIASLTLDSARSCMMYSASLSQRKVSMVPFVGSISPKGFLPLILLLVVIIATVVVMVVVVAIGGVSSILELSFMIIGFLPGDLIGVFLGPKFLLGLLVLAIVAAYASRVVATLSATSFLMAAESCLDVDAFWEASIHIR
ncbi:hypothetical protein Tco_0642832 [Tanacetum coccineum]